MHQVAAVQDQVGRGFAQVGEHRLEGGPVAVNVRYNRNAHVGRAPANLIS